MNPKSYKYDVDGEVKTELSKIKKDKNVQINCPIN